MLLKEFELFEGSALLASTFWAQLYLGSHVVKFKKRGNTIQMNEQIKENVKLLHSCTKFFAEL